MLKIIFENSREVWDARIGAVNNLKVLFENKGAGSYNFDLPSQAMWYRAMRADSTTYYYDGIEETPNDFDNNVRMSVLGRFAGNGGIVDNGDGTKTTNGVVAVGSYRPNAFGLYDMIGNVRETVRDKGAIFGYNLNQSNPIDPYVPHGDYTAGMGIFGGSWATSGTLWSATVKFPPTLNLASPNKYPDVGVRLAFFEGENPFKPKPAE